MDPFVLGALGVWRVTHALAAEDGPAGLLAALRRASRQAGLGPLIGCFYCSSVWVALPFAVAIGSALEERVLLWLALSGAACVLDRFARPAAAPPPAIYWEGEVEDGMLRRRTGQPGSPGSAL